MKPKIKLSVSFICSNLFNIRNDLSIFYEEGIDYIHYDIMDGHFVPRIGLGTFFLEQLTKKQPIPLAVHLMVNDPGKYIDEVANAGASIIIFHYETGKDIYEIIQKIKKYKNDIEIGIALRPFTPVSLIIPFIKFLKVILIMTYSPGTYGQNPMPNMEDRIKELKELLIEKNMEDIDIEIDGGITIKNIRKYRESGANSFVLGNSGLFIKRKNLRNQIRLIKEALRSY